MTSFPKQLTQGYQDFMAGRFKSESARYRALGDNGQQPDVMIIGCCDSRVSPEVIFDAGPGEMFVVRNVANLVPPYEPDSDSYHGTSAAIEFGVNGLNVKHIVVLGHASCGGVRSIYDSASPLGKGNFIGKWMSQLEAQAQQLREAPGSRDENIRNLEFAAVAHSLENLKTFPYIAERLARGELALHGCYFGVATGLLFVRNPEDGVFSPAPVDASLLD